MSASDFHSEHFRLLRQTEGRNAWCENTFYTHAGVFTYTDTHCTHTQTYMLSWARHVGGTLQLLLPLCSLWRAGSSCYLFLHGGIHQSNVQLWDLAYQELFPHCQLSTFISTLGLVVLFRQRSCSLSYPQRAKEKWGCSYRPAGALLLGGWFCSLEVPPHPLTPSHPGILHWPWWLGHWTWRFLGIIYHWSLCSVFSAGFLVTCWKSESPSLEVCEHTSSHMHAHTTSGTWAVLVWPCC